MLTRRRLASKAAARRTNKFVSVLIAANPFTCRGLATYEVDPPTRGLLALPLRDGAATVAIT